MARRKEPWKPGTAVLHLQRHTITDLERDLNAALSELESEGYGAGFRVSVIGISFCRDAPVICYRAENDPSFHPPM